MKHTLLVLLVFLGLTPAAYAASGEVVVTEEICPDLGRPPRVSDLLSINALPTLKDWVGSQIKALESLEPDKIVPEFQPLAKELKLSELAAIADSDMSASPHIDVVRSGSFVRRSEDCFQLNMVVTRSWEKVQVYKVQLIIEYLPVESSYLVKEVVFQRTDYPLFDPRSLSFELWRHDGFTIREDSFAAKVEPGHIIKAMNGQRWEGFLTIADGRAQIRTHDDETEHLLKQRISNYRDLLQRERTMGFSIATLGGVFPMDSEALEDRLGEAMLERVENKRVLANHVRRFKEVFGKYRSELPRWGNEFFYAMNTVKAGQRWWWYKENPNLTDEISFGWMEDVADTGYLIPQPYVLFNRAEDREKSRREHSYEHRDVNVPVSIHGHLEAAMKGMESLRVKVRMGYVLTKNTRYLDVSLDATYAIASVTDTLGNPLSFFRESSEDYLDHYSGNLQRLVVDLGEERPAGDEILLHFLYEGNGLINVRSGSYRPGNWSGWYPNVPHAYRYQVDFNITITVPKDLQAIAVGDLMEVRTNEDKSRTYHYVSDRQYAFPSFIIGDWNELRWDDIKNPPERLVPRVDLTVFTQRNASPADGRNHLIQIDSIIRFYEETLGPLPVDSMKVVDFYGGYGQGLAGMLLISNYAFGSSSLLGGREEFLAHEVSHQYWGHLVGWASPRDQWLSEGFANISAALYIRALKGDKRYGEIVRQWMRNADEFDQKGPIWAGSRRLGNAYTPLTYDKGGLVLHMLQTMLGTELFVKVLETFLEENSWSPVSTEDFIAIINKVVPEKNLMAFMGERDISSFFESFVYRPGKPSMAIAFDTEPYKDVGTRIFGKVKQLTDKPMHVPVPVTIVLKDGRSNSIWLPVHKAEAEFEWKVRGDVRTVLFNNNDLMWMDVEQVRMKN